ncbi:MAG: FHA domain-containing protein [Proteobacteria bacterium]|nr:FHA domain-containing protein [Pseudomonadota bacterium]
MDAAHLVFQSGELEGSSFALTGNRTVIGRVAGSLIIKGDGEISSIHAMVSYERGAWRVVDLGSTNGIYVDGKPVIDAELTPGSELRLGRTTLEFLDGPGSEEEAETDDIPSLDLDLDDDETAPYGPKGNTVINLGAQQLIAERTAAEESQTHPESAIPRPPLQPGPGVVVRLEVLSGGASGTVYEYHRDSITMGRADADLEIPDPDASRAHAVLEVFDDGHIFLRDKGSMNGTWVGERRIISKRLAQSDIIRIGACRIRFTSRRIEAKPRLRRDGARRR